MEKFIPKTPNNVNVQQIILIGQALVVKDVGQEVSGRFNQHHVSNALKKIIIRQTLTNVWPVLLDTLLILILSVNQLKFLIINAL